MTDHLEDECPPSWKECPSSFWEELIFAYLPHYTKIIPHKNYAEIFLSQLRKFVRWLDEKNKLTFYSWLMDTSSMEHQSLKIAKTFSTISS